MRLRLYTNHHVCAQYSLRVWIREAITEEMHFQPYKKIELLSLGYKSTSNAVERQQDILSVLYTNILYQKMAQYIFIATLAFCIGAYLATGMPSHQMDTETRSFPPISGTTLLPLNSNSAAYYVCRLSALLKFSEYLVSLCLHFRVLSYNVFFLLVQQCHT